MAAMAEFEANPEIDNILVEMLAGSEHVHVRYAAARIKRLETQVSTMQAENGRLCQRLAEAEEAIRPFAQLSPHLHGDPDKMYHVLTTYTKSGAIELTIPHFQAAANWLKETAANDRGVD